MNIAMPKSLTRGCLCVQTRVALSKDERKALKAKRRAGLSGAGLVSDFADEVAGVLDAGHGAEAAYFDKVRLGQKFGGSLGAERAAQPSGGARCQPVV